MPDLYHLHTELGKPTALWRLFSLAVRSGLKTCRVTSNNSDGYILDFFNCVCQDDEHVARLSGRHLVGSAEVRCQDREYWVEKAIIRPPSNKVSDFCPSVAKFQVALAPIQGKVSLPGVYFCQQGPDFSCAHAAVEMLTHHLSQRFPEDCLSVTREEVAQTVKNQWPLLQTKDGLDHKHICHVLETYGYQVMMYTKESDYLDWITYIFIESGLPTLVALSIQNPAGVENLDEGHATICIGHSFEPDKWWVQTDNIYGASRKSRLGFEWISSSNWTNQHLINDDNLGPAMALSRSALREHADYVIAALPRSVCVLPDAAEAMAAEACINNKALLNTLEVRAQLSNNDLSLDMFLPRLQEQLKQPEGGQIVFRTVLVDAYRFINHIVTSDYSEEVKKYYREQKLEGLLWLVELSTKGLWGHTLKLGEVIVRADIAMPQAKDVSILSSWVNKNVQVIHVPGLLACMREGGREFKVTSDPNRPMPIFRGPRLKSDPDS